MEGLKPTLLLLSPEIVGQDHSSAARGFENPPHPHSEHPENK